MNIHRKLKIAELSKCSGPDQLILANLGLISDPYINYQNVCNRFSDHKGWNNINFTIGKYGRRLMAAPAVVKMNTFLKERLKTMNTHSNTEHTLTLSCWTRIYPAFANSVDPDQLVSEEANWSRSALFAIK